MNNYRKKKQRARFKRMSLALRTDERECGECKECCTSIGVESIGKPHNTPCVHLCEKGCSIYAQRPESCKKWWCMWRVPAVTDHWGDDMRPDRCGVIFSVSQNGLQAIEVRENAFLVPKILRLTIALLKKMNCPVVHVFKFGLNCPMDDDFVMAKHYNYTPNFETSLGLPIKSLEIVADGLEQGKPPITIDDLEYVRDLQMKIAGAKTYEEFNQIAYRQMGLLP